MDQRSTMSAQASAFTPATQSSHVDVQTPYDPNMIAAAGMSSVGYSGVNGGAMNGHVGLGGNNPNMMPVNCFMANADTVVHFDRQEELICRGVTIRHIPFICEFL